MNEKQFAIDTPIGKIIAEGITEPYPEIVIYLKKMMAKQLTCPVSITKVVVILKVIFEWMCSVMSTRIIRAGRLKI